MWCIISWYIYILLIHIDSHCVYVSVHHHFHKWLPFLGVALWVYTVAAVHGEARHSGEWNLSGESLQRSSKTVARVDAFSEVSDQTPIRLYLTDSTSLACGWRHCQCKTQIKLLRVEMLVYSIIINVLYSTLQRLPSVRKVWKSKPFGQRNPKKHFLGSARSFLGFCMAWYLMLHCLCKKVFTLDHFSLCPWRSFKMPVVVCTSINE